MKNIRQSNINKIFPSPMGEDRISKFVRTLEILGEG
jgi:hypothetical protein